MIVVEVVEADSNKVVGKANVDLIAQAFEGALPLTPVGELSVKVSVFPTVDGMHVPGWPVVSTGPLEKYMGTVCLPPRDFNWVLTPRRQSPRHHLTPLQQQHSQQQSQQSQDKQY